MTGQISQEVFELYKQDRYDLSTKDLTREDLSDIKKLSKEKRADYARAPVGRKIIVNTSQPLVLQIFAAAHEYYHYLRDYESIFEKPHVCSLETLKTTIISSIVSNILTNLTVC